MTSVARIGGIRSLPVGVAMVILAALLVPSSAAQEASSGRERKPRPETRSDHRVRPANVPREEHALDLETRKGGLGSGTPAHALERFEHAPGLRREKVNFLRSTDGTVHTAQVFNDPVNYRAGDGTWDPIDPTMLANSEGYRNAANEFRAKFPRRLTASTSIDFTLAEGTISFVIPEASSTAATAKRESLRYRDVLPHIDFEYANTMTGYKETIILKDRQAAGTVAFRVATDGLTLSQNEDGSISAHSGDRVVALFDPPFAEDANVDPNTGDGAVTDDITYTLVDLGTGSYEIRIEVPQDWLKAPGREFPVVIDPPVHQFNDIRSNKDTYVQSDVDGGRGGNTELRIGSPAAGGTPRAFSFLTFDLGDVRTKGDQVHTADLWLYNFYSNSGTQNRSTAAVNRVTESWVESMTYAARPAVHAFDWATNNGCGANHASCGPWHQFPLAGLVQHWIDTGTNSGLRVDGGANDPHSWKKYYSSDATSGRPELDVWINGQPSRPEFASGAIANGEAIETDAPALRINNLTDVNGDDIYVRFQVARDDTFNDIVYQSGWLDETQTHVVPSGSLLDGGRYHWRVQSWDGYDTLGSGFPTSNTRNFVIALRKHGVDERWALWEQGLGNDMHMWVNEANGNLVLRYPMDSLVTPAGPLDLSVTYNSQATRDLGLGPGWEVSAGPASETSNLPRRLLPQIGSANGSDPVKPYGVVVIYQSGRREFYPHLTGSIYGAIGADAVSIRQFGDETGWSLTTPTGGIFTFDADGFLEQARPNTSTPSAKGFEYFFDTDGKLLQVVDPLNRDVLFAYDAAGRLAFVQTWTDAIWRFDYRAYSDQTIRVVSIEDPSGRFVSFDYRFQGQLTDIRDGEDIAKGRAGTEIGYSTPSGTPAPMATSVLPSGGTHPWTFDYQEPFTGSLSGRTVVTDPRGQTTTNDDEDYATIIDFTTQGLAYSIQGPRTEAGWPMTTQMWDERGNLVCRVEPLGIANLGSCSKDFGTGEVLPDPMHTEYVYSDAPPFRLIEIISPKPNPNGTGPRLHTKYVYDGFGTGVGPAVDYFKDRNLVGLPDAEDIWPDVSQSWGSGGPSNLYDDHTAAHDNFSLRWTGEIHADHGSDLKEYLFRFHHDDGGRLSVGSSVIHDCWGAARAYEANCGRGDLKRSLRPGWHDLAVEYQDISGNAQVRLEWKPPGRAWEAVPSTHLRPDLGLVRNVDKGDPTGLEPNLSEVVYHYDSDTSKLQGLPDAEVTSGNFMLPVMWSYGYDNFGRVTREEDSLGQAITHAYTDNGPGAPTDPSTSCETRTVTREGLVNERECNRAGDVIEERLIVGGQTRTTRTTYDAVGRTDIIDLPDGGQTDYDYDHAGRLVEERRRASLTETRTTNYEYVPQGWLAREVFSDPDGLGPQPRPDVAHHYDEVGNEIETIDGRDQNWKRTFDAADNTSSETDPLGNTWSYRNDDAGNVIEETDPAGVVTTRTYDVLSRETGTQVGTLTPSKTGFDLLGRVTSETDEDGVTVTREYNGADQIMRESAPVGPGGETRDRFFNYSSTGDIIEVTDFRGNVTTFDTVRTDQGRTETVTLPHGPPATSTFKYNQAGELIHEELPRQAGQAPITWDFTYDQMGRVESETDGVGNVTLYNYNLDGDKTSEEDPRGLTLRFVYDGLSRMVERRAEDSLGQASTRESFSYDAEANMTQANNATRDISLTYDGAGRLDTVTSGPEVTDYDYEAHRLASRTDAAGTTSYSYDANGRIRAMTDPLTGAQTSFTYFDSGRLKTRTDPNSLSHTIAYDPAGRLSTETATRDGAEIAHYSLSYNPESQVTARTERVEGGPMNGTSSYLYDAAGRLISATDPEGAVTEFGYDGAGNRTRVTKGGATVTTDYDQAGRPSGSSDGTTFSHDPAGNLTRISRPNKTRTFDYDPWDRMTAAEVADGPVTKELSYASDALDRTVTRSLSGVTTTFAYAGDTDELTEATEGAIETLFAYAQSEPLVQRQGTTNRFFGTSPHGDVTFTTNGQGSPVTRRSYGPYGEVQAQQADTGESQPILGFQGDVTDSDAELVDMGARFYEASLGRFTTPDILTGEPDQPLSLNRYLYGIADPLSNIDPDGLCPTPGVCPPPPDSNPKTKKRWNRLGNKWEKKEAKRHGPGSYVDYDPSPPPPLRGPKKSAASDGNLLERSVSVAGKLGGRALSAVGRAAERTLQLAERAAEPIRNAFCESGYLAQAVRYASIIDGKPFTVRAAKLGSYSLVRYYLKITKHHAPEALETVGGKAARALLRSTLVATLVSGACKVSERFEDRR